jgi:hypothetical protein
LGSVTNSYAEGSVSGGKEKGGLIGYDIGRVSASYATGAVSARKWELAGGVVGEDSSDGGFTESYWDTTTTGLLEGAGNTNDDSGLTGLTTGELSSGLPPGFGRKVWAEQKNVNQGFPYLLDNPPPK